MSNVYRDLSLESDDINLNRRKAIKALSAAGTTAALIGSSGLLSACNKPNEGSKKDVGVDDCMERGKADTPLFFNISLAQWSLHRSIFGKNWLLPWESPEKFNAILHSDPMSLFQGEIDPLDFPIVARRDFDIDALEYVNLFYYAKARDMAYWKEMKSRCNGEGVSSQLIMCNNEGNLGDPNETTRLNAIDNHKKWIDVAGFLGCYSIRVFLQGNGTMEEVKTASVDSLGRLAEYGTTDGISVIVENHGGYTGNGKWLADVISQVDSSYCGTLPDFNNFCIEWDTGKTPYSCLQEYDRYQGMKELLPFAKGMSAKSHDFDEKGNEINTDYGKMLKLVKSSGFRGYIGIEYEGTRLSEAEGIRATKRLLEREGTI